MIRKNVLSVVASAFLATGLLAATDENGLEPCHWLKLDGSKEDFGSNKITWQGGGDFTYVASSNGLAGAGNVMPYGRMSGGYGTAAWTVVEQARLSTTVGAVVWAVSEKWGGLGLVSGGTGEKVYVYEWTETTSTKLIEVAVSEATTKFHNYVVKVDPTAEPKTVTLYVDGEQKGTAYVNNNNWTDKFQLGAIYGSEPTDGVLKKDGGNSHDDWRLYKCALTDEEIKNIAAANLVWPSRTIAENTTLTDDSEPWTGNETVLLRATLELRYDLQTNNKLKDFTGDIVVDKGALLHSTQTVWNEDKSISPFGGARIIFAGGDVQGFYKRNNVTISNEIIVKDGAESSRFLSTEANSGSGCNTTLAGKISGGGKLYIENKYRWVHITGDISEFADEMALNISGQYSAITLSSNCPNGLINVEQGWCPVNLEHAADTELEFGDFVVSGNNNLVLKNSSLLKLGSRGGASKIDVAVTGQPLALTKVGAGTLTFGPSMTVLEGSAVSVTDGLLRLEGQFANLSVTVSGKGAVAGATGTGIASANIAYAEGSSVTIPLEEGVALDRNKTYDILTVAAEYTASGRPSVANQGSEYWRTMWVTNEDGSKTLKAFYSKGLLIIIQ